jgi:hypothetical protein
METPVEKSTLIAHFINRPIQSHGLFVDVTIYDNQYIAQLFGLITGIQPKNKIQ